MLKDEELDALFTTARASQEAVSDDFMGRLLGDAAEVSASRAEIAESSVLREPVRRGFWDLLSEAIGGWRGGSAIASALVLGVYVGLVDPVGVDTVSGLVASLSGNEVTDDASLYDLFLEG